MLMSGHICPHIHTDCIFLEFKEGHCKGVKHLSTATWVGWAEISGGGIKTNKYSKLTII